MVVVVASGLHAGIEAARQEAGLVKLTSYDIQVQSCECKRGFHLSARIAGARAQLHTVASEFPPQKRVRKAKQSTSPSRQ